MKTVQSVRFIDKYLLWYDLITVLKRFRALLLEVELSVLGIIETWEKASPMTWKEVRKMGPVRGS